MTSVYIKGLHTHASKPAVKKLVSAGEICNRHVDTDPAYGLWYFQEVTDALRFLTEAGFIFQQHPDVLTYIELTTI